MRFPRPVIVPLLVLALGQPLRAQEQETGNPRTQPTPQARERGPSAARTKATPQAREKGTGDARTEAIRSLLFTSGASEIGKLVTSQALTALKQSMPQVSAEFWNEFTKEVDPNELVDLMIPIYAKHLSAEDVAAITAFYESEVGQKLVGVLPQITQESMAAGQQWSLKLAQRVQEKLESAKKPKTEGTPQAQGTPRPRAPQ